MALFDVIQKSKDDGNLIWRYPKRDFNTSSQLIVHEGQEAVFFSDGKALDTFGPGRYTLNTNNIPLLKNLFQLTTGFRKPFQCEVYFIDKSEMASKWGTSSKIQFLEPKYNFPIEIGACGEMRFVIEDAKKILTKLVGVKKTLDNTNIDDFDDFLNNPCVLRKSSKYEPADLAIIQLKSQQTPEKAHIFDISGKVYKPKESYTLFESLLKIVFGNEPMECIENEKVNIGQQLYMIGYNSGLNIALTKEGIKSQITSGKLTQESDGERLLYDVKSMQGASGSPVIDEYGNLRAVNYAKFGLENNFNIGVSMNLIEKFLAE